ncbi:hypothetical protein Y032_0178g684 [Ancylostoma ceylanicum]|uniref:Uncharacterized protein n=1 Tax=Ancylostoma ceylanicum TaxID=53326 RepID=A0A016SU14_9BILA|nr:hypothetical protein Y032_0178g684 [Ancylostoma ceylanicum]
MPDLNEIVVIQRDDEIKQWYCLRIMVCKPGEKNALCKEDSIRIWFPQSKKVVTHASVEGFISATFKVEKGEIVYIVDEGCILSFTYTHYLRHRFQNKPTAIREAMKKYPGFYLQPTVYHPRVSY